jgi:hypothetical protein
MRGRLALFIVGSAIAGALVTSTPATAKPLEKGHFHDVFTEFFTCESTARLAWGSAASQGVPSPVLH